MPRARRESSRPPRARAAASQPALLLTAEPNRRVLHRYRDGAGTRVERADTGRVNVIGTATDGSEPTSALLLGWQLQAADERCAAAERRLGGIRALLADIAPDVVGGIADVPESWRSRASAAYAARVHALRSRLDAALGTLHEAEAAAWRELVIEQEVRERLRWQLQSAGISLERTGPDP